MRQFLPHIDPDADDPFGPSKFDEERMKYVKPTKTFSSPLHVYLLAQIDLFRILLRAGCSLSMYDKIIRWVLHYSRKEPKENLWTK